MIKIFNSEQIKSWDRATTQKQSIASLELMERASTEFSRTFQKQFKSSVPVAILCGIGNNGGDALAVGRILVHAGYPVRCLVAGDVSKGTSDFKVNLERARQLNIISLVSGISEIHFSPDEIIVDGLFGTGLSRAVSGLEAEIISLVNQLENKIVSIDIPSGLYADRSADGVVIQADHTYTFQAPKLSFFFPEHEIFVGQWQVLNIGLDPDFSVETESMVQLIEEKDIQNLFIPRSRYAHKGMNGHLLLVAGSYGKIGASVLAARSALRAGCGLVTAYVPDCGYQILQTAVPEAMVITDADEHIITRLPEQKDYACIALGPGLGTQPATASVVANLINSANCPMVIDADALNIIAADPSLISSIPKHSILTPHPGEFKRLAGSWKNDLEKFELLVRLAKKIESIIVLKGAYTTIALPDGRVFINQTGNAYMATGGCGDALTGVIAAFVCQGYEPAEAAKLGVWLHGLAGDIASKGRYPILAGDLINKLPKAWDRIFGHKTANSTL